MKKLLFAILVCFSSCRPCFNVHCDECISDSYKNTILLNFNSSDYSSAELDTFCVFTINIQTNDTVMSIIKNTTQPYNYVTLDMLTKYSPGTIANYKFLLQLKDTSKTITLEQINLLFEPEDKDGCCDCDKFLFQSVVIDGLTYVTDVLPLEVNK